MKILVTRTGALGDTILLSPVLQNLRAAYPGAEIHVLGHPERVRLLLGSPNADRVFSSEDGRWLDLHRESPPEPDTARWISEYGLVLSYSSREHGGVERNLRRILGDRIEWGPAVPPDGCGRHCVEFLLEPLKTRGLSPEVRDPIVSAPGAARGVPPPRSPFVVLHPGAGSPKKRWPLEHFLRSANALEREMGAECRFLLGPAEMDLRDGIENAGRDFFEGLSLDEAVGLLRSTDGFVGNDSGMTHLAAALGVPTAAVFTATDPGVWGPRGKQVELLDAGRPLSSRDVVSRICRFLQSGSGPRP